MKDKPIAQIAFALGFAEPSAFTRAFKTWSGTTPARWRPERVAEFSPDGRAASPRAAHPNTICDCFLSRRSTADFDLTLRRVLNN